MLDLGSGESRRPLLDEEATDAFGRHGPHQRHIGDGAVGDPHFRAVEHPVRAALLGVRLHVGRIRAALRLGEPEAADELAPRHARQVGLFLLLRAERPDRIHAQRGLHRDETADARVATLELLADESVAHGVESGAVVTLERGAEEAELGEFRHELPREAMFLEGLLNDGQYLGIHQSRDGLLYQALFLAQGCAYAEQIQRVDRSPGGLALGRVGVQPRHSPEGKH